MIFSLALAVILDSVAPGRETDDEALADDVLRSGDAAMYGVKRQGGGVRIVRSETPLPAAS